MPAHVNELTKIQVASMGPTEPILEARQANGHAATTTCQIRTRRETWSWISATFSLLACAFLTAAAATLYISYINFSSLSCSQEKLQRAQP
jgi:hypothetical protein